MIIDVYVAKKPIWLGQLQIPDNADAQLAANDFFGRETEVKPATPKSLEAVILFGVIIPTYQNGKEK